MDNDRVVKISSKRYSEIKIYAAYNDLKIVDIINEAVDYFLENSEEFLDFKQKHLVSEVPLLVSKKDVERLLTLAKNNDIEVKLKV